MRVLLDENVPKRLLRYLPRGVEATTVPLRGWAGKKNGELLSMASREFDILLTVDRSIHHQQNLARFDLALVVLHAKSNSFEDLLPLVGEIPELLQSARPGEAVHVEG